MKDLETRVQKWDNSLALRIPKPLASQIGLEPNSPVEFIAPWYGVSHRTCDAALFEAGRPFSPSD